MLSDQGQLEVSEILSSFDLNEIQSFVDDQILGDENVSAPTQDTTDHFHPLYLDFQNILSHTDDEDVIRVVNQRFDAICDIFLKAIEKKYCIGVSDDWRSDHPNDLGALTLALYSFFVLDHQDNLEEMLYNYILDKKDKLYSDFESLRQKKDASTIINRKAYSAEMAIIFANIYDVCTYILDHLTPMDFFEYIEQEYIPLQIIKTMYENGDLGGVYGDEYPIDGRDFTDCIAENFRENTGYKAAICFNVVNRLRNWMSQKSDDKVSE